MAKQPLLDRMRAEVTEILRISEDGLAQRLSTAGMMTMLLWQCGFALATALFLIGFVASESIFVMNRRLLSKLGPGQTIPTLNVIANWSASTTSTIVFCAPTPLLASLSSQPLLVAGLLWFFGVLVHISNSYVDLPIYNRSQVVPGYLTLAVTMQIIWTHNDQGYGAGVLWEWVLLGAFCIVHAINTFQTMGMQRDTRRALISAQSDAEARLLALERMSRHDPLTRLLNRPAFEREFASLTEEAAKRPKGRTGSHAVLVIDLDGFKPINDSYGHDAGDRVLRHVATRLQRAVQGRGIAARIGGDEFAVGLRQMTQRTEAAQLAQTLVTQIEAPITGPGPELRVGASIGLAIAEGGEDVKTLVSRADQAMYKAKTQDGSAPVVWNRSLGPRTTLDDRRRLQDALSSGAIVPHYQPKVSLQTGRIIGFEALARWVQPDGAVLPPRSFLPQVEALGLHGELLGAIAHGVLEDLPRLRAAGLGAGRISLNVPESGLATRSGVDSLIKVFEGTPGALPQMTFEITEDVLISRAGSRLQESISRLRSRGALISLDDFGTGYASFQHLRQLEFDELKIDKSFVGGLCIEGTAAVLVEGFMSIARGLGVAVVAEGVETFAQEARLRSLGCPFGQGYRYGKALPIAETEIRLLAQDGAVANEEAVASIPDTSGITQPGVSPPRAAPDD